MRWRVEGSPHWSWWRSHGGATRPWRLAWRLGLLRLVIGDIKPIKLLSWEEQYMDAIDTARRGARVACMRPSANLHGTFLSVGAAG